MLIYDDAGDYAALQAAEKIAETGARVEIMTRDRSFAPEVMAMSLTPSMRELQKRDVTFTVTWKLDAVRRARQRAAAPRSAATTAASPASGGSTRSW